MKIIILSPDKRNKDFEFELPDGTPVDIDMIKRELAIRFKFKPIMCSYFHKGQLSSRSTILMPNSETNTIKLSYIDKSVYPDKTYPRVDYAFSVDHLRFSDPNSTDQDFPEEVRPNIFNQDRIERNQYMQNVVNDSNSMYLSMFGIRANFDYQRSQPSIMNRMADRIVPSMEEEEDGKDEKKLNQFEEEDIDFLLELNDSITDEIDSMPIDNYEL